MQAIVRPSKISGTITAPASKSAMQRACAAALLKGGKTILHNPGVSEDDKAALDIIQQLGATVTHELDKIIIQSNGVNAVAKEINCGESGLSARMFTSIAALNKKPITVSGRGSLLKRPLSFFDEVLPQLGVKCESRNGLLPLTITGPLKPKNIEIDGSLSSQFLTGLLFAYSAAGAANVTIRTNDLHSKPYIDLTLKIMADFGLSVPLNKNYEEFHFPKQSITQFDHSNFVYEVEGDWSGAAFLLVAGVISGNVTVKGLNAFSAQADKVITKAIMQANSRILFSEEQIQTKESENRLRAFWFDATECPDLFPPLVALASYCEGTTTIEGVSRLTYKESNRAMTLQEEFGKMGIRIMIENDHMLVEGKTGVKGARVSSRHDHRIAMACAVAALGADGEVIIDDAGAVNKSYPQFWEHLQKLNADLSLNHN